MRSRLSAAAGKCLYSVGMLAILVLGVAARPFAQIAAAQSGWEPAIREFEEQDQVNPPKPGCIVFAGSSSFRDWDTLVSDMTPLDVVNRGFGGSEISDLNVYAKRIVIAYRPSAVVVYEGDNDLADGSSKTPQMVAGGFRRFIQIVHTSLPDAWIYILSIKPSKLRWNQWPRMEAANELIKDYALSQSHVLYIDVDTPMFDAKGNLSADLFKSDGLHPTAKLYAKWTAIIKPTCCSGSAPRKVPRAWISQSPLCPPWLIFPKCPSQIDCRYCTAQHVEESVVTLRQVSSRPARIRRAEPNQTKCKSDHRERDRCLTT